MTRLCTICARGGSRGVPNKNLREILGKPLIAYTIEQAKASGQFAAIAVSSDSEAILEAAKNFGADIIVRRPDELATDQASKIPAIRHCFETAERELNRQFPVFADLDVTSPLRLPQDIIEAIRLLETRNVASVITGAAARRSPYFNLVELDHEGFIRLSKPLPRDIVRRQDAPAAYDMNASVYVWKRDAFLRNPAVFYTDTLLYEMPQERSIDVDSELDFAIVEMLLAKRLRREELRDLV